MYSPQTNGTESPNYHQYRIFNSGSVIVFLGFSPNTTIANTNAVIVNTTAASYPIIPGAVEIISGPANSFFTGITAAGNSTIYVTPGFGV